ncbi:MAG: hypothetical protein HKN47_03855 [Pirellulaceae bacterium]|nr:hypothetical protein [Pirellulaceae bacterium]
MRRKLALGIYLVAGTVDISLGTTYFSARQFMSYHAQAVGAPWQELDAGVQTLILALMKLAGGGWFALGVLTIVMGLAAFKTRSVNASWTLPAVTLISWSASFAATWGVYQATGAQSPWAPSLAMIGFALLAFAIEAPWNSDLQRMKNVKSVDQRYANRQRSQS